MARSRKSFGAKMQIKKKNGPKDGRTYLENARDAWKPLPKWVEVLARYADKAPSQAAVARKCGFKNASDVSGIIRKTWPGRFDFIEAKVRGALMNATVICPVLGEIGQGVCASNQKRKFSAANPQIARVTRACKTCPNAIGAKHAAE